MKKDLPELIFRCQDEFSVTFNTEENKVYPEFDNIAYVDYNELVNMYFSSEGVVIKIFLTVDPTVDRNSILKRLKPFVSDKTIKNIRTFYKLKDIL